MCETKKPSWQTICGSSTRGSSPIRNAIRWLSNASCASHDHPISQPMSRVDERVGVLRSEVAGRIERPVGNHHLHRHAAARDRRVQLVRELHADARAAGEHARAARRGAVRDAQLRVLAVGDDVLGVELAVRHHLRQRHHRGGVRADRIRGDDVDVGVLRRLRGRDAAVDADSSFSCLLLLPYLLT